VLFFPRRRGAEVTGVCPPELLVPFFKSEESSISILFDVIEGVLEPVREGDCNGDSLMGEETLSSFGDINDAFSSPVMASEIALKPVALDLENKVLPGAAGDGTGRSIDEVSLPGIFGDAVTASMLGEFPYSSLVTVGGGDGDACLHGFPI
jgi:hypothetical protein